MMAVAPWFAITSAAASTVQVDVLCVEELSSSYALLLGWWLGVAKSMPHAFL